MKGKSYSNLMAIAQSDPEPERTLNEESESAVISVVDLKQPVSSAPLPSPTNYRRLVVYTLVFLALYLLSRRFVNTHQINKGIITFEEWLKNLHEHSPIRVYLVVIACINFILIFCVGSHSVFCVITALVLDQPLATFLLLLGASALGDLIVYFLARVVLREKIISRFKTSDFFMVLLEESKNEPFKTAFLTRLLFIPAGMKNYILATIDNTPLSFFSSAIILHTFYIVESILIARELTEIEQLLTHSQNWGDKSAMQKANFIIVLAFILFTVGFIIAVGLWAKRKVGQRQRDPVELNLKVS